MAAILAQRSISGLCSANGRPAVRARAIMAPRAALMTDVKQVVKSSQQKAPKAGFELGFTRDNEVFVGRLAMMGFASTVVGEVLSGQGALAQLGYTFGLPQAQVGLFLAGLISFNLVAGLLPISGTFRPEEVQAREAQAEGPLRDPKVTIFQLKKFFGVTDWGFTPQNELFAGRMAQLGFAAALLGEVATGLGPLAQFSLETGIPVENLQFGLLAWAAFMACTAVDKLTGKRSSGKAITGTTDTASKTVKQSAGKTVRQVLAKTFQAAQ